MSDMLGNRNRGIFAQYLVAKLIGASLSHPRMEWDCYDLEYRGYRIKAKPSSTVQTWHNDPKQRSKLSFGIAAHGCWDACKDTLISEKKRYAHLYVFCIFPIGVERSEVDVLELEQWRFYVTTTEHLETFVTPDSKQIGIGKIREICGEPASHSELKASIDNLLT